MRRDKTRVLMRSFLMKAELEEIAVGMVFWIVVVDGRVGGGGEGEIAT
jgi:hypothetical protein